MKLRFKALSAILLISTMLAVSGCDSQNTSDISSPAVSDNNPVSTPDIESTVDPADFSAAVKLMKSSDYEEAAALLDNMGTYRNADYLSAICHGFISEDFHTATDAFLFVDASKTFSDDEYNAYDSYDLSWDIHCWYSDMEECNSAEALDKLCECNYCISLLGYDDIQLDNGEIDATYTKDKDSLLEFGKVAFRSEYFDENLLSGCNGIGTGKVLIIEKGKYSVDRVKMMMSNMSSGLYPDKVPKTLSEVEYVIIINSSDDVVGVYSNGAAAIKYSAQVIVKQYPSGEIIYDSGLISGDDPANTVTVSGPTASIGGEMPDLSGVIDDLNTLLNLKY